MGGISVKDTMKYLYLKSSKCFELWNYLWLFSNENNEITIDFSDIQARFNIPTSSLYRHLSVDKFNTTKVYVELTRQNSKKAFIKFYPNGRRKPKTIKKNKELKMWVKQFYADQNYDYVDFKKHEKYVDIIFNKMKEAINNKETTQATESLTTDTVMFFFMNMPTWWKENAFTLPSLSKHFPKILHSIKMSQNGKTKSTKYVNTDNEIERINFS
jgi:hypothetical protein